MLARSKLEEREFAGARPRNRSVVDKVRKDGYLGVMFNKDDFMDAVVWAANIVYDYRDFYHAQRDRIVVPISDFPFWKPDVMNAHMLMIFYYNMKQNFVLVEELKLSLFNLAKFQEIAPEDVEIMKRWDEYMMIAHQKQESGDLSGYDIGSLHGTEDKYDRYKQMVLKEMETYKEELAKAKI